MSDDARPTPLSSIAHAGAVAVAYTLAVVLAANLAMGVALQLWGFTWTPGIVFDWLREGVALGAGVAVAGHRLPGQAAPRAALECAAIAIAVWLGGMALRIGALASADAFGAGLAPDGLDWRPMPWYAVSALTRPWIYAMLVGLALGLFLASSRRRRWTEGLALAAPVAAGEWLRSLELSNPPGVSNLEVYVGLTHAFHALFLALLLPILARLADALVRRATRREDEGLPGDPAQ